jgi:hypothetical protein
VFDDGSCYQGGCCASCPCATSEGHYIKVDNSGTPLAMFAERKVNRFHPPSSRSCVNWCCGKTPPCMYGAKILGTVEVVGVAVDEAPAHVMER